MKKKLFKSYKDIILLGESGKGPKTLGQGGYARVHLVHHVNNPKKKYAMKIIKKKNNPNLQ